MSRKVLILGSTGSIGTQTLDVIEQLNSNGLSFDVVGLASGRNIKLLSSQIEQHKPAIVSVVGPDLAESLKKLVSDNVPQILEGEDGVLELIATTKPDLVVNGIVGAAGLRPTLKAIELGIDVAFANKESLVIGGELVQEALCDSSATLLPVDSEHNALFQLIEHIDRSSIAKLVITASGGALRDLPLDQISTASPEQVLKHPNWSMGRRITVDSATLVNKAFEVIEAKWLYSFDWPQIEAIIHPQSKIHGLVELKDGSIHAHLGSPDMRASIQHALLYPDAPQTPYGKLDLLDSPLEFRPIDPVRYPAFDVVIESGKIGGTAPAVINAADEVAVERFLNSEITFGEIPKLLIAVLEAHELIKTPTIESILESDVWAREKARVF